MIQGPGLIGNTLFWLNLGYLDFDSNFKYKADKHTYVKLKLKTKHAK